MLLLTKAIDKYFKTRYHCIKHGSTNYHAGEFLRFQNVRIYQPKPPEEDNESYPRFLCIVVPIEKRISVDTFL